MTFGLTIFKSIFDNKTDKRMDFQSWEAFEKLLYGLSMVPGYKAKKGEKSPVQPSPLISPAVFAPNTTRANANVTCWAGWAALDVDSYTGQYEHIDGRLGPYHSICYSTASCTREKLKFRIVLPLTCSVPPDKIRHFWFALNKEFAQVGDEQTKDLSRMYYVPAQYPNAFNFIFTHKGKFLDPYELMTKHAYTEKSGLTFMERLPEGIRQQILESKKESMTNRDIHWNSYRDCKFVSKKLIKEYRSIAMIDGSGRYRMIYKIMTSIACNAVKNKYPITPMQIVELIKQLDADTAGIYQHRALKTEADRAIEFAYRNV